MNPFFNDSSKKEKAMKKEEVSDSETESSEEEVRKEKSSSGTRLCSSWCRSRKEKEQKTKVGAASEFHCFRSRNTRIGTRRRKRSKA